MPSLPLFLYQYLLLYTASCLALLVSDDAAAAAIICSPNILLSHYFYLCLPVENSNHKHFCLCLQLLPESHSYSLQTVIP